MKNRRGAGGQRARRGSSPPRVLVVYKKSAYELHARERRHAGLRALLAAGGPPAERLLRAHRDHVETLAAARRVLERLGVRASFRHRAATASRGSFDLVVTLGGDGTVLRASHGVGADCPLVAINTAPRDSYGHYCAGTLADLAVVLADALAGRLPETTLTRMRVEIDGRTESTRVLNDVLFCHASPAATTRYTLRVGAREETHKSSGVWIATAAGSTAAICSAGGRTQGPADRRLQYVVREPFLEGRPRPRLLQGFVGPRGAVEIRSHVRDGRLYLDGPHVVHAIQIGARLRLSPSHEPLRLLGFGAR